MKTQNQVMKTNSNDVRQNIFSKEIKFFNEKTVNSVEAARIKTHLLFHFSSHNRNQVHLYHNCRIKENSPLNNECLMTRLIL